MNSRRRGFLVAAGQLAGCIGLAGFTGSVYATPETMASAVRQLTGAAEIRRGKVTLDIPPLVENGNSVEFSVIVDSPMTPDNHVRAIHVLAEKNPLPNIVSVQLGPRSGRARITTRARLADSQKVVAIAELSDGTYWSGSADVVVTLAACLESLI